MSGMSDPREVLSALRRMESEMARVQAEGLVTAPPMALDALRAELADEAASERRALVEDMELLLDVMEAGWRRTHDELARVTAQLEDLRTRMDETRDAVSGATFELRLRPANGIHRDAEAPTDA